MGLVEFACILYLHQYNENHLIKPQTACHQRKIHMVSLSQNENGSMVCLPNEKKTFDILKIDRVAFVVVGALFVLFNITYWVIFLAFDLN